MLYKWIIQLIWILYHISLALAYKNIGDSKEAIKCCQDSLSLDSNNILANYNLAVMYQDIDNVHVSIDYYLQVLALDNKHIDSWLNLS